MVVGDDSDMLAIERAGLYDGLYFVLGGLAPLIESKETQKLRGTKLKRIVETREKEGLKEIILAFSVNPDGENTTRYVRTLLKDILNDSDIRISLLGRGLSTGSELEYADAETIKNALENRH
jgi:recombination protein RecR